MLHSNLARPERGEQGRNGTALDLPGGDGMRTIERQASDILGVAVLTRWLLIGLLISVGALLFVAGAVTRHILRQRRIQAKTSRLRAEQQDVQEEPKDLPRGDGGTE
jgi:hypothetical protein